MQQEQQAAAQSQQEQMMQQTMMSAAPGVAKEMVKNNKDMSPEQMAEMTQQQTEE